MTVTLTVSRVAVIAEAVADCLCQQIADDGLPSLCYCGVMPGSALVADRIGDCGNVCGMAWVRVDQIYPATSPGVPSTEPGNCSKGLGMDMEVGILRCFPADPTDADLLEAAELQLTEAETMFRAVSCCPALSQMDTVLAPYTPIGPDGATIGGVIGVATLLY